MDLTRITAAALAALAVAACGQTSEAAPTGSLFAAERDLQWRLPDRLHEISGLAVSPDGRLFGHDDEIGVIYEIDSGEIVKWFAVGEPIVTGDFEGLTITPEGEFWLITSTGRLYRFREGADHANVTYERFNAHTEDVCEIEGVAHWATAQSLILACKRIYDRDMEDRAALRTWRLGDPSTTAWGEASDAYAAAARVRRFEPSEVTIDPQTGRILVLAANSGALVELSPEGEIVSARALSSRHNQAEGAAVLPDGSLVIADEGGNDQALLSRYPRAP